MPLPIPSRLCTLLLLPLLHWPALRGWLVRLLLLLVVLGIVALLLVLLSRILHRAEKVGPALEPAPGAK
jgi:hypothetical protein